MIKRCLALMLLFLLGCNISKEFNVVKIDESSNGKTVSVPEGYRLSILLQARWYKDVEELQVTDGIKILGLPDRQEQMVHDKLTQFVVVSFAIYQPGSLRFRYDDKSFFVQVIRQ